MRISDWSSDVCSSDLILRPQIGSSPFVFGADGMLESGLLTQAYGSWRGSFENAGVMTDTGSAVHGQPFVSYCPDPAACTNGMYFQNEARNFDHSEKTRDLSATLQWEATHPLHFKVAAPWIKATPTTDDILLAPSSMTHHYYRSNN